MCKESIQNYNFAVTEKPVIVPEVASQDSDQQTVPKVQSVDDFCPDEGLDASFLDDVKENKSGASQQTTEQQQWDDRYVTADASGFLCPRL